MDELKNRAVVLAGAALLATVGRDKFYHLAQERRGLWGRIASAFCGGHAGRVSENFAIYRAEKDKDRITDVVLRYYSDDSLYGFADEDFSARGDGKPLPEQQRGMILPLVEQAIAADNPATVLEIGTGNGDILAYLAERHPEIEFTGIDLSVVVAERKHTGQGNVKPHFTKGYALDRLREGLTADLVFASSTFVAFAPNEFAAYLDAMPKVKRIIISDPITFGHKHNRDPRPYSLHMDSYMWWHNYWGYLTSRGWTIDRYETASFAYSYNPNVKVILVSAGR